MISVRKECPTYAPVDEAGIVVEVDASNQVLFIGDVADEGSTFIAVTAGGQAGEAEGAALEIAGRVELFGLIEEEVGVTLGIQSVMNHSPPGVSAGTE